MGLIDQAREDIRFITTDLDGFGVTMILTAKTGEVATISGLHSKHHLGIDTEGVRVNTKNAHCSFSEKVLVDQGFPTRNERNELDLKGTKVTVKDSTGMDCLYVIRETYPSETVGLIVCILGDFE